MGFGRASGREERREPNFGAGSDKGDMRLTAADRPTGAASFDEPGPSERKSFFGRDRQDRREPNFDLGADREPDLDEDRREPNFGAPRDDGAPDMAERRKSSYWSWVMGRSRPARSSSSSRGRAPARRKRSFLGRLVSLFFVLFLLGGAAAGGVVLYYASRLPPIENLEIPKRPPNVVIAGYDGKPIANRGETGGAEVPLKEMPKFVPQAFIAIEDRRFRDHWGVDVVGLARAVATNVMKGRLTQGGSTLTQQLAKNLFLTPARSLERKVQEAVLAFWLERKFGKDKILEMYLNRVYFGAGAYGVEAAAQRYFGKSIRKVNVTEAAILAGLVKAPSRLSPMNDPEAARRRADLVLQAMADENYLTRDQANVAFRVTPPSPAPKPQGAVGYAADWVMEQLDGLVGLYDEDLVVETTIDPRLESEAEKALADGVAKRGGKLGVTQGVVVSLAPDGAVKALVGGKSYAESQFNRAVAAKRQPGSAFKPFVYLAALEEGLDPETVRTDAPLKISGWTPENYTRRYGGPMTLTYALSQSVNTVAVRLGIEAGPVNVTRTAERLGVASPLVPNPSIALGTSEVTPLELAGAYAAFANGGQLAKPYIVRQVKTAQGEMLYKRKPEPPNHVIDATRVGMMNYMLQETLRSGTARSASLPGWQAAGKTGTSQDFRDAWFIGYTSELVTAVWVGNDDNSPTKHASGGGLPVSIWSRFMTAALQGAQPVALPGDWSPAPPPVADTGEQPGDVYQTGRGPAGPPVEDDPYPSTARIEEDYPRERRVERRREDGPIGFLKDLFGRF
ncbi:PBP1A family penicillin-binding protein [Chelatococcus sambhunathii]|uniref:peptidoglycan glycosyltransferase n=1 Tax=Chelatococcus sambhunathii TaxID=363953 RepID=A0ABU1DKU0_9HYPH|nr:PBP1A family penicillin-binding protein [Chelatococcus sambhunathii]MDR4308584.1 PBP1A family penicillin-binding protein [Chelatococcus sambhunathii]